MAAASEAMRDTAGAECPICSEDLTTPKLFPCLHQACRHCTLQWLTKGGPHAGCPLCREPILTPAPSGQADLAARVDQLPTDLATVALVDSLRVLQGPHVCVVCGNGQLASRYCLECRVKLCTACTKHHKSLPLTSQHPVQDLTTLTPQRLAAGRQSKCKDHPGKTAELYCPHHHQLLCALCSTTAHRSCQHVTAMAAAAREKREEVRQQADRLRGRERGMVQQMQKVKNHLKTTRDKVRDVFDDLQQHVQKRRQEIEIQCQTKENDIMTSLAEHDRLRASLTSHAGNAEDLASSAPDDVLLLMVQHMTPKMDELESRSPTPVGSEVLWDVTVDAEMLSRIRSDLSTLGKLVTCSPPAMITTAAGVGGQSSSPPPAMPRATAPTLSMSSANTTTTASAAATTPSQPVSSTTSTTLTGASATTAAPTTTTTTPATARLSPVTPPTSITSTGASSTIAASTTTTTTAATLRSTSTSVSTNSVTKPTNITTASVLTSAARAPAVPHAPTPTPAVPHAPTPTPAVPHTLTSTSTSAASAATARRQSTRKHRRGVVDSPASPDPTWGAVGRAVKAGDRVKLARGWHFVNGGAHGTVTASPSRLAAAQGWDPHSCVDVRWDTTGQQHCYCMGYDGMFHLEKVSGV